VVLYREDNIFYEAVKNFYALKTSPQPLSKGEGLKALYHQEV
jgi:hypothetical protein